MPAPTMASFGQSSSWVTFSTTKTASVSIQSGDIITFHCSAEDSGTTFTAPTNDGAALTWTLRQDAGAASNARETVWTAVGDSTRTLVVTGNRGGVDNHWGCCARAWRGSDGVGATNKVEGDTTADFSVSLTTTQANSAIDVGMADWSATGGTRTYLTATAGAFTEQVNVDDGTRYSTQHGYHADAGTVAAKTIGVSLPTGQDLSITVIEIKGTGSAATSSPLIHPARRLQPILVR